jgi:hypothetical protein
MKIAIMVSAVVIGLGLPRIATADQILFSSLAPDDGFATSGVVFGTTENQTDPSINGAFAFPFVSSETALLSKVEVAVLFPWFTEPWWPGSGSMQVNLFASENGVPGTLLESFTSPGPHLTELAAFDSVLQPQLLAGALYFLETRAVGFANGVWFLRSGDTFPNQPSYARRGDGPWLLGGTRIYDTAAFRISGESSAVTPEPATIVLLGTGMALVGWRRRRQRS